MPVSHVVGERIMTLRNALGEMQGESAQSAVADEAQA